MASRGVHFAIERTDAERLLSAASDEAVLAIVQDEIEERWEEEWLYQTDKAWDAIHRCLTGGRLSCSEGPYPLKLAVLGGDQLHEGEDYLVSFVNPEQAGDVARALRRIDRRWLRGRYDSLDADLYGVPKTDEDWEYTWDYFSGLPSFFERAAEAGRYVLFSVDL
ncbi:MAG: YfbM family protein [Paludibaculum sp.]